MGSRHGPQKVAGCWFCCGITRGVLLTVFKIGTTGLADHDTTRSSLHMNVEDVSTLHDIIGV